MINTPGNAGLRTLERGAPHPGTRGSAPALERGAPHPLLVNASTEPRVPSTEPRVPSTEPRVPSTEPRVPSTEPRVPECGWHSRGYLPHFDSNHVIQHVTFHLADSLPKEMVERLVAEIQQLDPERQDIEKRHRLEALIDAGHGACWLRRPDCAQIVQNSLLHFDGTRYRMIAWVVMPNHVHALFQTIDEWSMDTVVGSWKTFTANAIGRIVRQPNEFAPHVWHPEFWDRFIRNENHFASARDYIHNNPVKAGLAAHPEDWPWSSANPGNAGLRTRERGAPHPGTRGSAPALERGAPHPLLVNASTEPRVPGTEPRVPSTEPRVPSNPFKGSP